MTPPPPPPPDRDPILDDPLFAELVEDKPRPDLKLEPAAPPPLPVAAAFEVVPEAGEVELPRAEPAARPRPRPVAPPPPRRAPEEPVEPPRPRVFAACAVIGCFGLGMLGAVGLIAYAAILLLGGLGNSRSGTSFTSGPRPQPVTATQYAQDTGEIPLPSIVDGVGRAAGGRYLLLRSPREKKLSVFDPVAGQVVHTFDLGDVRALFAGSASKLYVYRNQPDAVLERWNLETHELELSLPKPPNVPAPDALVVGAGVDGPVYALTLPVNGQAFARVLNPETLRETAAYPITGWQPGPKSHVRASDDGTCLTVAGATGAQVVRIAPNEPVKALALGARGAILPSIGTPSRDGQLVYTPYGLYDAVKGTSKLGLKGFTFPAAHGTDLFLSQGRKVSGVFTAEINLHLTAAPDESVTLDNVTGPLGGNDNEASDVPNDQRVHLWPAAGLAAVLTVGTNSKLLLTKVDVPKVLKDSDLSYLVVGSDPPAWATRGVEWRYRPVVWTSEKDGVTLTVVEGPTGMRPGANGEIVWTPGERAEASHAVCVRVTSTADETIKTDHRFRVNVLEPADD